MSHEDSLGLHSGVRRSWFWVMHRTDHLTKCWASPPSILSTAITLSKHYTFLSIEHRINRRKPRNYKGLHPQPKKTSRCELTAVERAFIAGACIVGSLSHNDCANLFGPGVASKSTVTRTCQRVNERAIELNTTIIDPRCFEFLSKRGPERLLSDEQRAQVIAITIESRESREKES
jgi:hypothetical protein